MKKLIFAISMTFLAGSTMAQTFGFSDIVNWTGTGTNRSALVIDWNDGTTTRSMAWGYRWTGAATAEQMLRDIDTSDPHLTLGFTIFSGLGAALTAAEYDANLDGVFEHNEGGFNLGSTGFWDLYNGGPSTTLPTWDESNFGISSINLADGTWEGVEWAPNFVGAPPVVPIAAPVPEPSPVLALSSLGALLAMRRRKLPA
jgi:hypothetical protein